MNFIKWIEFGKGWFSNKKYCDMCKKFKCLRYQPDAPLIRFKLEWNQNNFICEMSYIRWNWRIGLLIGRAGLDTNTDYLPFVGKGAAIFLNQQFLGIYINKNMDTPKLSFVKNYK